MKVSRGEATGLFPCKVGVRQGCNLSPLLFSLFISGLEAKLGRNNAGAGLQSADIDLLMYADNIVMMSASEDGLRKHLQSLDKFCACMKLEININKTKVSIFGRRPKGIAQFPYQCREIEVVSECKYLGVWLTTNGRFGKAQSFLANQGKKAIFALLANLARMHLFDTLITPILCYGCEIWVFEENADLDRSEMRFLKYILHLPPSATSGAVCGELGQLPLHLGWKQRFLRYWNRLCEEEIPSLLKEAVMTSNAMLLAGQDCWLARVKELFGKAGFASSFNLHGCEREVIEQLMLIIIIIETITFKNGPVNYSEQPATEDLQVTSWELTDCLRTASNLNPISLK